MSSNKKKLQELLRKRKEQQTQSQVLLEKKGAQVEQLSYEQLRLWFLNQYMGPSPVYNIPLSLRIKGRVDVDALRRCLNQIMIRQESLRTHFEIQQGQPVQVVSQTVPDLQLESVGDIQTLKTIHDSECHYAFDLNKDALCRIRLLFDQPTGDHIILLTMNHAITDGWSMGIILAELMTIYPAFEQGLPCPLPPLPIQYSDYAYWQRKRLNGPFLAKLLSFWRKQLHGLPELVSFPADRPRPLQQSFRGGFENVNFDNQLFQQLQLLSSANGATLFMTLLAGFSLLLSRYSGCKDVPIGTPTANRGQAQSKQVVGFFTNTLVMRCNVDEGLSFNQLLQQTRAMALRTYDHSDIPFDKLVEELNPKRNTSYPPLFQVMFALQSAQMDIDEYESAVEFDLEPLKFDEEPASTYSRFDLTFNLKQSLAGITGGIEYNSDLFERQTIKNIVADFEFVLNQVVANPAMPIAQLPLMTPSRRQQILSDSRACPVVTDAPLLPQILAERAQTKGQDMVLKQGNLQISFAQLQHQSHCLAFQLQNTLADTNRPVGIYLQQPQDFLVAAMACLAAGICYVPLNVQQSPLRLGYLLERAEIQTIIGQANVHLADTINRFNGARSGDVVALEQLDLAKLIAASQAEKLPPLSLSAGTKAACISWVEDLQGRWQPYVLSQHNFINLLADPDFCCLNNPHIGSRLPLTLSVEGAEMFKAIINGTTFDADEQIDDLADQTVFDQCGEIYILNRHGEPVPVGVVGELYYGCSALGMGFLAQPAATAAQFVPHIFGQKPGQRLYRSGDLARRLNSGQIEYIGRCDQTQSMAPNEPSNLTNALLNHPLVEKVYLRNRVIQGVNQAVAYLVLDPAATVTPSQAVMAVAHDIKALTPVVEFPYEWQVVADLPLLANGEVDSKALPPAQLFVVKAYVPPEGEVETAIAEIWQQLLSRERIGRHENFFELGGHSLLATQLQSAIKTRFVVDLAVKDLFEFQTIEQLAGQIQRCQQSTTPSVSAISKMPANQPIPLSFAQQRLWFLSQYQGPNAVYNMPLAMAFDASVDITALNRAIDAVVNRHDALRTRFVAEQQSALQKIDSADFHAVLETIEDPQQIHDICRSEFCYRFDLSQDRLCRIRLLKDSTNGGYVLSVVMHHCVSDGWSIGLFFSELVAFYEAFIKGEVDPLPPLAIQYGDYAYWQRSALAGERFEQQIDYWRKQLDGLPNLLTLPTDRPRPVEQTYCGSTELVAVPPALTAQVRQLAKEQGVTLYMTLLSAFAILLSRYSGQQDIAIGTPIGNRDQHQTQALIGFFINSLVMRSDLADNPSFIALLQRNKIMAVQAYAHQDVPFEQLVEAIKPQRSLSFSPLFQVSFSLVDTPVEPDSLGSLSLSPYQVTLEQGQGVSRYDLTFNVSDTPQGIVGSMEYNTDLFDRQTIARMGQHFVSLLSLLVADPHQPVANYDITDDQEKYHQLVEFNHSDKAYQADLCVHQLFEQQVAKTPGAIAVMCQGESFSYGQINGQANQVAHFLRAQGISPDARVGICVERSSQMVVGLLGILKAGGCYVPLDPEYPPARLEHMLAQSGCKIVLSEAHLLEALEFLSTVKTVPMDGDMQAFLFGKQSQENLDFNAVGVRSDNLAYIIYTSGSTGVPKGNGISHRNINRLVQADFIDFSERQTFLCAASLSFDAFTFELWGALLHGNCAVLADLKQVDYSDLGALFEQYRIDTAWLTTAMFNQVINDQPSALAGLKNLMVGGEALSLQHIKKALRALPNTRLINGYGPTESTTFTCTYPISAEGVDTIQSIPIGKPIANTQVYVLDPQGNLLPRGVVGELCIGGDGLARGYIDNPGLTAGVFVPNEFTEQLGQRLYCTGDLVRYLADGNIEFIGRIDHQVKVRGFRIELSEIETVLLQHPQVKEAVVLARAEQGDAKVLVAYVVLQQASESGDNAIQRALMEHLQQHLPDYMVPSAFVFLSEIKLTANNKVDRQALPQPDESAYVRAHFVAPTSDTEQALALLWQANLSVERIGVEDNYFTIGGDSIRSIAMVAEAKKQGISFTLKDLFVHPTIAALAKLIDEGASQVQPFVEIAPFELVDEQQRAAVLAAWSGQAVADIYPMSMLQEGMVFHSMKHPELRLYHTHHTYLFKLVWDEAIFAQTLEALVDKHPILRTRFYLDDIKPMQVVLAHGEAPFAVNDLRDLPALEQEARLSRWMASEKSQPIDVVNQAWRIVINVLNQNEVVFGMTFHHALWDGWSNATFVNELLRVYRGLSDNNTLQLEPSPPSYKHFIQLEQQAFDSEQNQHYWRDKLEGAKLPWFAGDKLESSVNFSYPVAQSSSDALVAIAQRLGVQQKSVWNAVYLVLLSLLDGSNDVVGSVVVHGRPEISGGEKTLGLFLNSLPVRIDLTHLHWRDLLLMAEQQLQQLHQVRYFPLVGVQALTGLNFSASMFNYTNFHAYDEKGASDDIVDSGGFDETNFRFTFQISKNDRTAEHHIHMGADPSVFDEQARARISEYVGRIVEQLGSNVDGLIDKGALLDPQQRQQLLTQWNDTSKAFPQDLCIHQQFERQAERNGDTVALIYDDQRLSYAALNQRANQLAHCLMSQGIGTQHRVGVCMTRSFEMVIALLGILKSGAGYVPLDPTNPKSRLAYQIDHCGLTTIVTQQSVKGQLQLPNILVDELAASAPLNCILLDDIAATASFANSNPELKLSPENLAYILYTSGSTGTPKGVAIAHRALVNRIDWMQKQYQLTEQDKVLQKTPFNFDVSVWEFFWPLMAGCSIVIAKPEGHKDGHYLAQLIEQQQLSVLHFVPSMLNAFLSTTDWRGCHSVRQVFCSGEALSKDLQQRFFATGSQAQLDNLYGPTEAAIDVSFWTCQRNSELNCVPIGKPIQNISLYVVDSACYPVALGCVGELLIGGVGLSQGYFKQPSLSAKSFIPNPFANSPGERLYRTGDLVRYLDDGNIDYIGRVDHQVKLRGFRVELGEIETIILTQPQIKETVVLAHQQDAENHRLLAYVVLHEHASDALCEQQIVDAVYERLQQQLPSYMVPATIDVLAQLPLTANGKVDRAALMARGFSSTQAEYVAPRNDIEQQLCLWWQALLKVERVGINDNFWSLGGHSLLALRLGNLIRQQYQLELPLEKLFKYQNIKDISDYMQVEIDARCLAEMANADNDDYEVEEGAF